MWPTPRSTGMAGGANSNATTQKRPDLTREEKAAMTSGHGGQLNPSWVAWLMGWPIGWTDCDASATDKYREWCRSHGICSQNKLAEHLRTLRTDPTKQGVKTRSSPESNRPPEIRGGLKTL